MIFNKYWFRFVKSTTSFHRILFLITCLTCISIGWTSARYTTTLFALSDGARTAKFSYKIDNEVFKVNSTGDEISQYESHLNAWEDKAGVNFYDIDTGSGNDQAAEQKIKVVFNIEIDTETALKFKFSQEIPDRPLDIEKIEFSGEGITPMTISEPTTDELFSFDVPPMNRTQNYKCIVLLRHDGRAEYDWTQNPVTGKPKGYLADKYINLIPSFEQID